MAKTKKGKERQRAAPFTLAAFERVCGHISEGSSIQKALELEGRKNRNSFFQFILRNEKARLAYEIALEIRTDCDVEDVRTVAVENEELEPQRLKIHSENLKWCAARKFPKKYGDKQNVEHSGTVRITHEQALAELA